ncbi:hypothetical protein BN3456_00848 [Clostridium sp. C105KSO13]|nr:hypothetical protein BN3456_00848 [Clostridium sp. C105KSO13]
MLIPMDESICGEGKEKRNDEKHNWAQYKSVERATEYDAGTVGTKNVYEEADTFKL